MLLDVEILVDSLGWKSLVLSLVSLHLSNEIDKMLRFLEEFELFSVNKIAEFIFNLDHELDHVEGVETMFSEIALERYASFLGCSEIVLEHTEDVFLNLVVVLQHQRILLLGLKIFPEGNLIGGLVLNWHEVNAGVETEVALEASGLESDDGSVLSVDASTEADVVGWLDHLGHGWILGSDKTSSHNS